jgi:hypothetical protein
MKDAELRDLVRTLTRPRPVDTHRMSGVVYSTTTGTQPPLLVELRRTGVASIGQGGSGKAAHERMTMNVGAFELYTAIEKRVRSWAIRSGYRPPPTGWPRLEEVLAHWHARTDGDPNLDPKHYAKILRGWVAGIADLIDPPYRFPIEQPCPRCGAEWTTGDIDTGTDPNRALNVIERIPADRSVIVCHACGAEWHGVTGAHALRDLIEHAGRPYPCAGIRTDLVFDEWLGPALAAARARIDAHAAAHERTGIACAGTGAQPRIPVTIREQVLA